MADFESPLDQLFGKQIILRFDVTDRAKAQAAVGKAIGGNGDPESLIPGLRVTDFILRDTSQDAKEFWREIATVVKRFQDRLAFY